MLPSQVVEWGLFGNSCKYRPPTKDFSCSLEVARFQEWIFMTPTDANFYKALLDHMSDGVYFVDLNRRIQYWNEGAYRLTGYKAEELVGRCCLDDTLCHVDGSGRRLCLDGCPLQASMKDGSPHEAQVFLRHKQGRRVPVAVRVQPLRTADGSIIGAVEIFNDNTAQLEARRRTEEMERLAFLDQLTRLPNRRFVEMSLRTGLSEFQVHKDPFGVLLIDLNQFKAINDGFGHNSGDRALQEVAKPLSAILRPTDIVGRWGGDEFVAIVRHVNDELLSQVAARCRSLVAETSFTSSDGRRVTMSISIGGTLALLNDTAEGLIKRADDLMYQNKMSGRVLNDKLAEKIQIPL